MSANVIGYFALITGIAILIGWCNQLNFFAVEKCWYFGIASLRYIGVTVCFLITLLIYLLWKYVKTSTFGFTLCPAGSDAESRKAMKLIAIVSILSFIAATGVWYALKTYKNPTVLITMLNPLIIIFTVIFGYFYAKKNKL
jgi:hypothetical protein